MKIKPIYSFFILILSFGLIITACNPTAPEADDDDDSGVDTTNPSYVSAVLDLTAPNELVVTFSEAVNIQSDAGWTIRIDSIYMDVLSISGSGTTEITFTLSNVPSYDAGAWTELSYDPSAGNVADLSGNSSSMFGPETIDIVDPVLPVVLGAWCDNFHTNRIRMSISENLINTSPATVTFYVTADGSPVGVINVNAGFLDITLYLSANIPAGSTVLVSMSNNSEIMDRASNYMADFGSLPVTNNISNPMINYASLPSWMPTRIWIGFDKFVDIAPNWAMSNGFTFTLNGGSLAWSLSSYSHDSLVINLDEPVYYDDILALTYTSNQGMIQCYEGLPMADAVMDITNEIPYDPDPPLCTNIHLRSGSLSLVRLYFDEFVNIPSTNGFSIMTNGFPAIITGVSTTTDDVIYISLSGSVTNGTPMAVLYNAASGAIADLSRNPLGNVTVPAVEYR